MLLVEELMSKGPTNPDLPGFHLPQLGLLNLLHLPIHESLSCLTYNYTCLVRKIIKRHHQRQHAEHKRVPDRPSKFHALTVSDYKEGFCPRLTLHGCKAQHFAIISPAAVREEDETLRRWEMAAKLPELE